jgi:hypothetical protein
MIQRGVIRNKIEHQPHAAIAKPLTQTEQSLISADRVMNAIARDRETRAGDVFVTEVWKRFLKFRAPFRIGARDTLSSSTGLPHAQEPNPIEAHGR